MAELLKVGDKIIPTADLLELLSQYQLMPHFLRGIAIDKVIADIELSEEEKLKALYDFRSHNKLISDEDLAQWQRENNMPHERLDEIATRPVKLEKFKQETFSKKLENYFMEQKGRLDKVVYSLIRVTDEGLAQEIYYRIEEGEASFADMAQEYSEGPESKTQGILGPVPINQPHPFIAKMLSVSQPGQLWAPRAIANWFIIVRLEQAIPAQLDDNMRRQLLNEMFDLWLRQQVEALGEPTVVNESGAPIEDSPASESLPPVSELTPEPA
ncbi:MAG: peptidylprolyl isomerase [Cyanobacteria bacterium P01_F01_bin.153]